MIVYGALIVVVIVTLIFYLINPKEYKWWEFGIPLFMTTGMIFGAKALTDHLGVMFTEFWGETIVEVYEQEPWNEWIHQTCTRQVACGVDADGNTTYCTETYDCSYQADYGPEWYCKTNIGNTYPMSERLHDSLVVVYGTGKKVVKTMKNHDSRDKAVESDGTKFAGTRVGKTSNILQTVWPNTDETRKGVFTKHRYENRVKASDLTVFNISVVSDKLADSLELYDYPEEVGKYNMPVILGDVSYEVQEQFRKLNAKFGPSNQLRLWILLFEDKPAIVSSYQENYWVRGNKNELVICIGLKEGKIQWAHSFSWALSGTLTAATASKVLELYEYTVTSKSGEVFPIAIPIVKEKISDVTGIDTSMIPSVLPLPFDKNEVQEITKSESPVLNERTWNAYYNYLNENLHRFERRPFAEFSYLKVEPSTGSIIIIYVLALIISGGINIWASRNVIKDLENIST